MELGFTQSGKNMAVFVRYKDDELIGLVVIHVDDFLHAGDDYFRKVVIPELRGKFEISTTGESNFRYTGININSNTQGIEIDQDHYISESVKSIPLESINKSKSKLQVGAEEHSLFRAAVGSVNWAAQQTRPDISFEVLEMSMKLRNPTFEDLQRVNKCVKKLKFQEAHVMFRKIQSKPMIVSWSDAAFANLQDQVSSGCGYVIFLADEMGNCCPLVWQSNKVKRVVKSTLAAEALAFDEALGHCIYLRALFKEILGENLPIISITDSANLLESLKSSKEVDDKRLRLDIASIKQDVKKGDAQVYHVRGDMMLADCLTKKGASAEELMNILREGRIPSKLRFW